MMNFTYQERQERCYQERKQRQMKLDKERKNRLQRQCSRIKRLDQESFERKERLNEDQIDKLRAETLLVYKQMEFYQTCIDKVREHEIDFVKYFFNNVY